MQKVKRSSFVSLMLATLLLSIASWQAASAASLFQSTGPEVQREVEKTDEMQSKIPNTPPEATIDCSRSPNYAPSEDGTKCVFKCPAGKIPAWGGTCKEKDGDGGTQNNPCTTSKLPSYLPSSPLQKDTGNPCAPF